MVILVWIIIEYVFFFVFVDFYFYGSNVVSNNIKCNEGIIIMFVMIWNLLLKLIMKFIIFLFRVFFISSD